MIDREFLHAQLYALFRIGEHETELLNVDFELDLSDGWQESGMFVVLVDHFVAHEVDQFNVVHALFFP